MLNPNHLFPRLSITAKLAIAFVVLSLVPLLAVAGMSTGFTVEQIRAREGELLEHDLETVGQQTGRSLRELARQVSYAGQLGLEDRLLSNAPRSSDLSALVAIYLAADSSALVRVKVIDAAGSVVADVRRSDGEEADGPPPSQPLYLWLASQLGHRETGLIPVELRTGDDLLPAIAVVHPVRGPDGTLRGAIVGEASAAEIFSGIEDASPEARGITALVDHEGRFLYHTTRKRDWATLLARRGEVGVHTEFDETVTRAILSGEAGTIRTDDGRVATYRPLRVAGLSVSPFFLYRTFPQATLGGSVRRYLAATGVVAVFVVLGVLGVAVVAARQITRPLHRLQEAARKVTSGRCHDPLKIETNDEIQDLSEDFEVMAAEVNRNRKELESEVEERTLELRRTKAELSRIVSLSADGIVGLDADGKVRLWNRGATQLFGYSEEEAVGRDFDELIRPDGPPNQREEEYLRRALEESGAVVGYQTVRKAKDGSRVPVGITQTPLRTEDGSAAGSSVILRDNRMNEQLQRQMRRSERMAAVSVMAAGLAHELNNPVAILDNRIELMQREAARSDGDGRLESDLSVLRQHVRRLGAITGDLLRFARDESDEADAVDVNDVAARVGRLMDRILAAEGVGLELRLDGQVPPVLASPSAVETVLVNLVLNAQQASPPEGIVTVETRCPEVSGRVEMEIRDQGPGVPQELRHRIFEPFFTTKAESGGTGLGLAVCRTLVERQGGTIHLARGNGKGAVFVLSFPVADGEDGDE